MDYRPVHRTVYTVFSPRFLFDPRRLAGMPSHETAKVPGSTEQRLGMDGARPQRQMPIGIHDIQSSVRTPGGDGGTGASPFCLETELPAFGEKPPSILLRVSDAEPLADPGAWGAISPTHSHQPLTHPRLSSPSPSVRPSTVHQETSHVGPPKWQWSTVLDGGRWTVDKRTHQNTSEATSKARHGSATTAHYEPRATRRSDIGVCLDNWRRRGWLVGWSAGGVVWLESAAGSWHQPASPRILVMQPSPASTPEPARIRCCMHKTQRKEKIALHVQWIPVGPLPDPGCLQAHRHDCRDGRRSQFHNFTISHKRLSRSPPGPHGGHPRTLLRAEYDGVHQLARSRIACLGKSM